MALDPGATLGPYEIVEPIGAGGMGEVYLARDTRLDRRVAIKVLPEHLADNSELRQRFEHEARAVSSLNHPNICTLHDVGEQDGVHFLVMEHLEGETLAQRLTSGALPFDEAMRIAVQLADALEKAHARGVVHRDLKPGNIMLTRSGAKLMDFGLAKSMAGVGGPISSVALTQASPMTAEGTIVGTFQYMSPEQLQGKPADARSDVFSFGAVIYEMLTGRRAFEAENQASLIVAIMSGEPPAPSSLVAVSPPALDRLIARCLAKDPEQRWHSVADLGSELRWIAEGGAATEAPAGVAAVAGGLRRERLFWGVVVAVLLAALVGVMATREKPAAAPAGRLILSSIIPPENMSLDPKSPVAISPDGGSVAFVAKRSAGADSEVTGGLWVRRLDEPEAHLLPGTEGADYPFWSPDSRWLGFFASGKLRKINVREGLAVDLCAARDGRGGSWSPDGVILFQQSFSQSLSRVPAGGGTPEPVTQLDSDRLDVAHRWPQFLPDGRRFLFYLVSTANPTRSEHSGVYVGSLDSAEVTQILSGESRAVYAAGHLIYRRGPALMARPFDATSLRITGDEVPLAGDIPGGAISWGGAYFDVHDNDLLIYLRGADAMNTDLTWYGRDGEILGTVGPPASHYDPRLSHDGTRVLVSVGTDTGDLWIHDIRRDSRTRFTFDPADDTQPLWSPDDTQVVFKSSRVDAEEIYMRDALGSNPAELLLRSEDQIELTDWSRDGKHLLYARLSPETGYDLWSYSLADGESRPLLEMDYHQLGARLSPDGRWLAYNSDESGQFEIYVQGYPEARGRWMVSNGGGLDPLWRGDGKEIYYVSTNHELMAVAVETEPAFTAAAPVKLFVVSERSTAGNRYDVTRDGQRFLVNTQVKPRFSSLGLILTSNWTAGLDR